MDFANYQSIPGDEAEVELPTNVTDNNRVIYSGPLKKSPTKGKRILLIVVSCTILFIFYRWYFHPIAVPNHPFVFDLPSDINSNPPVVDVNITNLDAKHAHDIDILSDSPTVEMNGLNQFDSLNRFVMSNYQNMKPMSNFLPGIGGKWGKPYWLFYTNRGQGVASFGIQNKDGEMLQFQTANVAYQQVATQGFRSFLNGAREGVKFHYSPYSDELPIVSCIEQSMDSGVRVPSALCRSEPNLRNSARIHRDMHIGMNEVEILESNPEIGLDTSVLYYTITGEAFAGLIRSTTFTNTDTTPLDLDILDGLASVLPPGLINAQLTTMGRTLQAWMNVYNINTTDNTFKEPFYRISQSIADTMKVEPVYEGNYVISYVVHEGHLEHLPIIVDPTVVFDVDTTMLHPSGFYNLENSEVNSYLQDIVSDIQCSDSKEYRVKDVSGSDGGASGKSHIEHGDGVTVIHIGNEHATATLGIKKLVDDRNSYFSDRSGVNGTNSNLTKCNYAIPSNIRKLLLDSFTKQPQLSVSQTPCAFAGTTTTLAPGESINIISIYGHAESLEVYYNDIAPVIKDRTFADRKLKEARDVADAIVDRVKADTSDSSLNLYIKQNFLDCELRGGFPFTFRQAPIVNKWIVNASATVVVDPVLLKPASVRNVEYIYSRVHGDMERDYNFFQIPSTYFSQGPGNYRDVAQNRRSDVKFEPQISYQNIKLFLNLIQSDGYNPLTVSNPMYIVPNYLIDSLAQRLSMFIVDINTPDASNGSDQNANDSAEDADPDDVVVIDPGDDDYADDGSGDDISAMPASAKLVALISKPFRLGSFFEGLTKANLKVDPSKRELVVQLLLSAGLKNNVAAYAQNGFWADHWTYILDMIDSYLGIFPDEEVGLLWGAKTRVGFYASPAVVLPRAKRYQLAFNGPKKNPDSAYVMVTRAISAVNEADYPSIKASAMNAIFSDPTFVVDDANADNAFQKSGPPPGSGEPFTVDLHSKLIMLAVLKAATVDIEGLGVEMEGGKPGWNDALNGLPGMMGSGMAETYELLRLVRFLKLKILDVTKHHLHSENWNTLRNISVVDHSGINNADTIVVSITIPNEFARLMQTLRIELVNILGQYGSMLIRNTYGVAYDDINLADDVYLSSDTDIETNEWETYIYNKQSEYAYWDRINTAKERYRSETIATFSGDCTQVRFAEYIELLNLLILKLNSGIYQALQISKHSGLTPTYFYYRCYDYEVSNANATLNNASPTPLSSEASDLLNAATSSPHVDAEVRITGPCSRKELPIFLEGIVRYLKILRPASSPGSGYDLNSGVKLSDYFTEANPVVHQSRDIYKKARGTPLYDQKLEMYRLSVSLAGIDRNIGRLVAFPPGWLENESIWLHMSYKYYLELLRNGLFDEFYREIKHGLVPYINNTVYGRSPLEAASFIVSSAFPSNKLHGNSYLARLSGATAEFISMWDIMTASAAPFIMVTNPRGISTLALCLRPSLASYLFHNTSQSLSFTFLGSINVTYINPSMSDTWKLSPVSYQIHTTGENDGKSMKYLVVGNMVKGALVASIRNLLVSDIVVTLG